MKHVLKGFALFFVFVAGGILFVLSNQIGGWRAFIVSSSSMEPAITTGSLVVTKYVHPNTLQPKDIITFIPPTKEHAFVTHRITKATQKGHHTALTTQGDNNQKEDNWHLAGGGVVGKVIYTLPYIGYLLSFIQTKIGILLFILLPAAYIIVDEIIVLIKLFTQHKKKTIQIKETVTIALLLFFSSMIAFPQPTFAVLSDNAQLTTNTFTVVTAQPTPSQPRQTLCGDTHVEINNNGRGSTTNVSVSSTCMTSIVQSNMNYLAWKRIQKGGE